MIATRRRKVLLYSLAGVVEVALLGATVSHDECRLYREGELVETSTGYSAVWIPRDLSSRIEPWKPATSGARPGFAEHTHFELVVTRRYAYGLSETVQAQVGGSSTCVYPSR